MAGRPRASDASDDQQQRYEENPSQNLGGQCWSNPTEFRGCSPQRGCSTPEPYAYTNGGICNDGSCINMPPVFSDGRGGNGGPAKSTGELPAGVYNEDSALNAVHEARSANKPVVSFVVGKDGLDAKTKATMDALKNDVSFVAIDHDYANWLKSANGNGGLEHRHFWALSNLSGAAGDTNRIRPNTVGVYDPKNFNDGQPQRGLNPKATAAYDQTFDLTKFLGDHQIVSPEKLASIGSASPAKPNDEAKPRAEKQADKAEPLTDKVQPSVYADYASVPQFTENNVLAAARQSQAANNPLLSYVKGDGQTNPNVAKALDYLQQKGLATTVQVDAARAQQMMYQGLESKQFYALNSAANINSQTFGKSVLNSFNGQHVAEQAARNAKSQAYRSVDANSPDAVMDFFKQSNVTMKPEDEAAVSAILRGQPIPEAKAATEVKPEAEPKEEKPVDEKAAADAKAADEKRIADEKAAADAKAADEKRIADEKAAADA
ncbi:MAG: hypothetical protein K2W82_08315, partial [Candidatus Obscuribacterales bacterium]|nr:hypothetical protein [Candidatus Obscuribacterales bacterium]